MRHHRHGWREVQTARHHRHGWAFDQRFGPADSPTWVVNVTHWYPHREKLESINPTAIAPNDWGLGDHQPFIFVPVWSLRSAGFYINLYRMLAGYRAPQERGV